MLFEFLPFLTLGAATSPSRRFACFLLSALRPLHLTRYPSTARSATARLLFAALALTLALPAAHAQNTGSSGSKSADAPATDSRPDVPTDPNHVLSPQDLLRLHVFQEPEINKQSERVMVSQQSTITLPLIGAISVKGKTVRQTEEMIRALYDRDFLVNPQVSIVILKYAERVVNVIGSVTKQGRIEFPSLRPLSIVDAIALAGGQTRLADLTRVRLTRINENGDREVTEVNVDAMMKQRGAQSVLLQPGDVIYVPERML